LDVDTVIVTHNSAKTIESCLASLVDQVPPSQIYIIDTDSSDATLNVASRLGVATKSVKNGGFGFGCNTGAALGIAPFILFLNPDARLLPNAVAQLTSTCAEIERLGHRTIVGPWIGGPSPDRDPNYLSWTFPSGLALRKRVLRRPIGRRWLSISGMQLLETKTVSGSAFLIRRRDFVQLGGFDESFFLYFEDADLARRAANLGIRLVLEPRARVIHEGGHSTGALRDLRSIQIRSNLWYARKHFGRAGALACAADLAATSFAFSAIEACRGERSAARSRLGRLRDLRHPLSRPQSPL
jgi:N-acetylglucosaminyl-diphospho-decaprenol L-rhamnosyltransferase